MLPFWPRNHRRFQEQLSAFIDGQLPHRQQQRLQSHLQSCQDCRRHLEELQATVEALRALPLTDVPRSFTLSQQQVEERRPLPLAAPLNIPLRLATAAVAVVLAVVVVVDFADLTGGGQGGPELQAPVTPAAQFARERALTPSPAATSAPEGALRVPAQPATPAATPALSDEAQPYAEEQPQRQPAQAPAAAAEDGAHDALRLTEIALGVVLVLLVVIALAPVTMRRWLP